MKKSVYTPKEAVAILNYMCKPKVSFTLNDLLRVAPNVQGFTEKNLKSLKKDYKRGKWAKAIKHESPKVEVAVLFTDLSLAEQVEIVGNMYYSMPYPPTKEIARAFNTSLNKATYLRRLYGKDRDVPNTKQRNALRKQNQPQPQVEIQVRVEEKPKMCEREMANIIKDLHEKKFFFDQVLEELFKEVDISSEALRVMYIRLGLPIYTTGLYVRCIHCGTPTLKRKNVPEDRTCCKDPACRKVKTQKYQNAYYKAKTLIKRQEARQALAEQQVDPWKTFRCAICPAVVLATAREGLVPHVGLIRHVTKVHGMKWEDYIAKHGEPVVHEEVKV